MKKKILSIIFAICLIVPAMFLFTACGDDKSDVEAPELYRVFQDSYGNVLAEYSELHNNYAPEFSLDSRIWNNTHIEGNFAVLIRNNMGVFTYLERSGTEHTELQVGQIIEIGIRECETKTTHASKPSNTITITLKETQDRPNNIQLNQQILNKVNEGWGDETAYNSQRSEDLTKRFIVYDKTNNKFVLSKKTHYAFNSTEQSWSYKYEKTDVSQYEYCVVNNVDYPYDNREINVENAINNEDLTFETMPYDGFEINDSDFKLSDDGFNGDKKSALVVIRKKALTTKLPSPIIIQEVFENEDKYGISSPGYEESSFNIGGAVSLGKNVLVISIKNDSAEITKDYIKQRFPVIHHTYYEADLAEDITDYVLEIEGNKVSFTSSDIGSEFAYTIYNTGKTKTLLTGKIVVEAYQQS